MKKFLFFLIILSFFILPCLAFGLEGMCIEGDCINGKGVFISSVGHKYIGFFKGGEQQGQGTALYFSGGKYIGEFRDGKEHGQGKCTFANGDWYVGEYANGKINGKGKYFFSNGDTYIGEFRDGKEHGQGKYTSAINGDWYVGEYANGKINGKGTFVHGDGTKYVGDFKNNKREGKGKMVFPNGEVYKGGWQDDKRHGFGMQITSSGVEKYEGEWRQDKFIKHSAGVLPPEYSYTYKGERDKKTDKQPKVSSGTAFYINRNGHLITNHHVISDCKKIQINSSKVDSEAKVLVADATNDLAVIKSDNSYNSHVRLRGGKGVRVGEDIIVTGFPLVSLLGETIKVTRGNISSVTGIDNDTSIMQISAPIQPGSSGGPVLDMSGNVVGVVSSKLNELVVAKATGSLPQNINFAIKSLTLQIFLDTHGINYELENSNTKLEAVDIAEKAQGYTVRVKCYE